MHPGARLWAGALVVGLLLGVARVAGLPESAFAVGRALCSIAIAGCAMAWLARNTRMTLVAGLLASVAWIDLALVPGELGWIETGPRDLLLSVGALPLTVVAYLVLATTQVPSDRRGAWAAMAWLALCGVVLGVVLGRLPTWAPLLALALAVALTVRFLLGIRLYEIRSDPEAASRGLRLYRLAFLAHVLLAVAVWTLVDAPWVRLVLLVPYGAMIVGIARFAHAAPHPAASLGAGLTCVVPVLHLAGMLELLDAWHARLAVLLALAAIAASLAKRQRVLALTCVVGICSIPVAFRFAGDWITAALGLCTIGAYVALLTRAESPS